MKLLKNTFILIFAIASILFVGVKPVCAESSSSAQGLQISPAKVELNAARGKTYDIRLSVMNVTSTKLVYSSTVNDFTAAGETGSPKILTSTSMPATASIRSWVSGLDDFTLNSRQSNVIYAHISIPLNAEPGGHYGVLSFSGTAPDVNGTGVGLSASAGVLMLIRVDGDITEKASVASFYSGSLNKPSFFFESAPISFIVRVKNEGNVHVQPIGTIKVSDTFGNSVASIPVNSSKSNVLPKSIRRFGGGGTTSDEKLQMTSKSLLFGHYTAQLTLGYGLTGQALTSTISFWVIPYKLILIIILILGTVFYIIRRMVKIHNRRVIERYKNENGHKKNSKK